MAVVLAGFGTFVYLRTGRDLMASVDLGLRARAQVTADAVRSQGTTVVEASGSLIDPDESFAQVTDASGMVLAAGSDASKAPFLSSGTIRSLREPTFFVRTIPEIDTDPLRLLAVPITASGRRVFVVVGTTLGDRRDSLNQLFLTLGIAGPVVLIVVSVVGWMALGAALRPVERMRREAAAISASEPDRRLPVPATDDELGRLGTTLNAMLDRLQEALQRERRFVDDASHELRTPLAVLKMELDLALARGRTPRELEAALRSASAETDRLVRLARDLLVLARMERGRLPVHRTAVSLEDLVRQTVAPYADRARGAGARFDLDVAPATASVDPVRVRQAVENLLDNAVQHTPPGGAIRLVARVEGDRIRIAVQDSGPGFPPNLLATAFEPFARGDGDSAGGNGEGSGAGLGLSIVRAIAEAHDGTATAENLPDGARVTLTLPVG
jgi:signal transduction histidine kinase